MRVSRISICIPFAAALMTGASAYGALANDELIQLSSDAKNWAMQTGDYANTRYSKLNQINKDNVKSLQVKWTFSTGVLCGHEGGSLVIGDVMYVHTVPEHRLRPRSQERRQDSVEVRTQAGSQCHPDHVLRHGQSWRRLR